MSERPRDLPIQECADLVATYQQVGAHFYQKWTCAHCGARQTMEQADTWYQSGKCEECGQVTIIDKCGFLLHIPLHKERSRK